MCRTGVVSRIPCTVCPAIYVGQAGRCLNQRLKEHRCVVELGDSVNSTLAAHACTGLPAQLMYIHQRLILESNHIRNQRRLINIYA